MTKQIKTTKNETPAPATDKPAPKKRGRTHLTEADKAHMQECRVKAAEAKGRLAKMLAEQDVADPEVWQGVPPCQYDAIVASIKAQREYAANAVVADAKAQYLAACKAAGETPDPALVKSAPTVDEPKKHKYSEAEKKALAEARGNVTNGVTLGLLDEAIANPRLWEKVPKAKVDAILAFAESQGAANAAARAAAAKATLAALLKG